MNLKESPLTIAKANDLNAFEQIEKLAWKILPSFYRNTIPTDHTEFYIEKFISPKALQDQVSNGYSIYLLTYDHLNVGYLALLHQAERRTMLLDKLYVLQKFRGKGIGSDVIDFVIAEARSLGCHQMELVVNIHNNGAIRFYERYGFELGQKFVNHFENGHSIANYNMRLCIL